MRISSLSDLPAEPARAVIINVGTELVATLALASAVEHAGIPVLLVNCEPTRASSAHFERIMSRWSFDLLDAPRRTHADALDQLFREIRADLVLLLDSDAEIRDAGFIRGLREWFDMPHVFGAGFVHGPHWLPEDSGGAPGAGLYNERAWLPCVMLRTAHVRAALDAGVSFRVTLTYNDVAWSRRLSKLMASRFQDAFAPRFRPLEYLPAWVRRRLQRALLPRLAWTRRDYFGLRPNYVLSDTGTHVYQWCKYQRGLQFAGVSSFLLKDEIKHYWGVTRRIVRGDQRPNSALLADIEQEVSRRLVDEYGLDWPSLSAELDRP